MKTFKELRLSCELVSMLDKAKITTPTEIQEKAIPLVVAGKDIFGESATGSGKTLVFAAPIIENLKPNNHVQALILTPTRELAEQISNSIKKFSRNKKLNVLSMYGGVDINLQIRRLGTTDVVVGTPGRILDHLNRRTLDLRSIKYLVLDEVDRMFDMGFFEDVNRILKECPENRQTMLFSATISEDVYFLAKNYTKHPAKITVKSYVDSSKLKQIYYDVEGRDKFSLLVHLLKKENKGLSIVFCSTRKNVEFVNSNLLNQKIDAIAIHGGMGQKKRLKALDKFNSKDNGVLICTDVAARGLDLKGVNYVYNYDLPKTSEEYIHRIGRTARAGEKGIAINILASRDYDNFSNIQIDEKLEIEQRDTPRFEKVWVNTELFKKKSRNSDSRRRDPTRRYSKPRQKSFERRRPTQRRDSRKPKRKFDRSDNNRERSFKGKRSNSRKLFSKRRRY